MNDITKICTSDAMKLEGNTHLLIEMPLKFRSDVIFCFGRVNLTVTEKWPEACVSLTGVGAGTMHVSCIDPIKNPTIWFAESRNQVSKYAYRVEICINNNIALHRALLFKQQVFKMACKIYTGLVLYIYKTNDKKTTEK